MKNQAPIAVAIIAIGLSGCARVTTQPFSTSHPGNPAAPEGGYPAATPTLTAGTNPQTSEQQISKADNSQGSSDKTKNHDEHDHNLPKK